MCEVIVVSGNPGQGKTTVAVNLAFALRSFGRDVLLVDGDVWSPKVNFHIGLLPKRTLTDVLAKRISLQSAIYLTPAGVKVLAGGFAKETEPHPSVLLDELRNLADVVVIDVPSNDWKWLQAGERVVAVAHADFPSAMDIVRFAKYGRLEGVVMNRFVQGALSVENMQNLVSLPVIGVLPEDACVRDELKGSPVVELYPDAYMSMAVKQLAAKLMNVEYTPVINGHKVRANGRDFAQS